MTQARILLIDDDEIVRDLLGLHLELQGFEVLSAADGQIGLQVLREQRVDLIVLDLMMPVMDGLHFMIAKAAEGSSTAPVIVLSAAGHGSREQALRDAGAREVMRKPVKPQEFLARVKAVLGGQQ